MSNSELMVATFYRYSNKKDTVEVERDKSSSKYLDFSTPTLQPTRPWSYTSGEGHAL
jgi:hypothetical protein